MIYARPGVIFHAILSVVAHALIGIWGNCGASFTKEKSYHGYQSYLGVLRLTCEASDVVSSIGRDYMKVMLQSISRRQYLSVIKFERYEVRTANN